MTVLFIDRKNLERAYCKWLKENKELKDCPFNVICFLAGNGLLDEEAIHDYLQEIAEKAR